MSLDVQIIRKHLMAPAGARDIRLVDTVESTNLAVRELARSAAPGGPS